MRSKEEIQEKFNEFLKQNPISWVYNSNDETLMAYYQGYTEAMKYVLGVENE